MQFLKLKDKVGRLPFSFLVLIILVQFTPLLIAQNLGSTPQTNKAVQGQTASQPEGAFLNLVNWVGNVIAPVGAALCIVMAIISYTNGRGVARWAISAGGLLMVSGLTRLLEFWIQQGQAGIQ
jgi:heme/copper-type cytochrome/quinol oxidase subunit 1